MGFRGAINQWIMSYLSCRQYSIKVGEELSESYSTDIGTPQGSVLGPLIFLLFINDLSSHITGGATFIYADDTTIVVSDSDLGGLCRRLENVITQFKYWCDKNRLMINFNKTQYVFFRGKSRHINFGDVVLDNYDINFTDEARFLGAVVDSCFTWKQHVEYTASKLNSAYYAIGSLKSNFDRDTLMTVYYSLVYPHLSYAVVVWGQSVDCGRLFIIQKRIVRLIFNINSRSSCREAFRSMNILTLASVYLLKVLTYIHENRHILQTHSDKHGHYTRGRLKLCQSKHHHSYYERSPLYAGVCLYNLLPSSILSENCRVFKKSLKKLLIDGCFYDVGEYVDSMLGR